MFNLKYLHVSKNVLFFKLISYFNNTRIFLLGQLKIKFLQIYYSVVKNLDLIGPNYKLKCLLNIRTKYEIYKFQILKAIANKKKELKNTFK